MNHLCHGDQNQDSQYKENLEVKNCDVNLDTIFQIADEVMQTPNNCLVRVVTPEKPGTVSFNNMLQASPQDDNPGSTRKANPLCSRPIIMAVSGNINLVTCEQQEGSVFSVPEQMPEDVILEVRHVDVHCRFLEGKKKYSSMLFDRMCIFIDIY